MTFRIACTILLAGAVLVSSCNQASGERKAALQLRDGTTVSGTVLSSSAKEIQLAGDDKTTHTIPMAQVRSIEYADPPSDSAGGVPTPAASAPQQVSAAPAPVFSHEHHYHAAASAITTKTYELSAGTEISVRTEETIDSGKAAEGQTFAAEVTKDVADAAGDIVIPHGSNAQIVIRSASKGGKIRGASDLVMDLASVSIDGRLYDISSTAVEKKGRSGIGANRRTGVFTGGGAAIGAIIGAIAGGGKGAAIGAGSGAGAGALTQILTKGTIKVPVETVLTFKLDQPLAVRAAE